MKRLEPQQPMEKWDCDGCDYQIGPPARVLDDGTSIKDHVTILRIPTTHKYGPGGGDGFLEFHFHGPGIGTDPRAGRSRDCFRYWAHSPHVMERSLKRRTWTDEQIDEFMATHLYRSPGGVVGIARPT